VIDLHTHTTASDGTVPPPELVGMAVRQELDALAITDHDTLEGCDEAAPVAAALGLELVPGVELSNRLEPDWAMRLEPWLGARRLGSIHLLGYFLHDSPPASFRSWILGNQEGRRKRNVALVEKLRGLGFDITLAEASALGRNLTGRPHFAKIMVRKGYVATAREAFELYLGDHAKAAVEREEPGLIDSIGVLRRSGGVPVLAHPGRLPFGGQADALSALLEILCAAGLQGIEVWHSDHSNSQAELYQGLAAGFGLESTGGSDFHGANKPSIALGTGLNGNIAVPKGCLEGLRRPAHR
jgi:predicted metal-dependent phosphoesterase TrpH